MPPCGVSEKPLDTDEYDAVANSEDEKTWEISPLQTVVGPVWFQEAGGGRVKLTLRPIFSLLPLPNVPIIDVESKSCRFILAL